MTAFHFDVVSLPPSDHPTAGETAPDFTRPLVTGEYWEDATLSEVAADGPVLLAFLPMDGTGLTTHTCIDLRRRGWADDVTVVGYSISTPYEHLAFVRDHDLPFPLFSDPRAGVAERYDVTHDHGGMTGLVGARPAFFLLEADLTVAYAWAATEWPASRPYAAVERAIDAL